jgi:hypothetical protein
VIALGSFSMPLDGRTGLSRALLIWAGSLTVRGPPRAELRNRYGRAI